jgi:hypothetical protein
MDAKEIIIASLAPITVPSSIPAKQHTLFRGVVNMARQGSVDAVFGCLDEFKIVMQDDLNDGRYDFLMKVIMDGLYYNLKERGINTAW